MSRFVLTAQLQLQAPNNVAQVVRQIQSQLNNVNVNVQVQGAAQAQRQLQQVTAQTQAATTAADRMGRAFAVSIRRFAAFSIATRAVGLFTSTLSDAIKSAIDFEREMVRVSQVTGESIGKLRFLTKAITDLSTGLGVSSKDLLTTGQLLLQAGVNAKDTEIALKTLAKAALAPNFDSLSETTEGAIAILAQFQEGVGALEKQLGAINAVAGAFAVEAGDLIDVIRRAGGVFKSSGGDLNELIALFTSVRATTRESAESIGTGLRTIFTRIQRPKTIEFLKQFGVELVDLEGRFVGPFEAVKRLSTALSGLGEGDITFIRIAEELGGFRQIGKVLPLLQQFSTAQAALNVANKAGNSLATDAATAQQALAIRIVKVKEEFLALVRSMTETSTFQIMANTALSLASALIKIGEAIKPLLPMLAAVAAVNFARGISTFAGGLMRGMQSGRTYSTGGKVHHFARGGMVPGTGNRDTVPAMLQPGEFVIKKSSVNKLGAGNLAAMNENRYAAGGTVKFGRGFYGNIGPDGRSLVGKTRGLTLSEAINSGGFSRAQLSGAFGKDAVEKATGGTSAQAQKVNEKNKSDKATAKTKGNYPGGLFKTIPGAIGGFFLTPQKGIDESYTLGKNYPFDLNGKKAAIAKGSSISNFVPFRNDLKRNAQLNQIVDSSARSGLRLGIKKAIPKVNSFLDIPPIDFNEKTLRDASNAVAQDKQVYSTVGGYLFEGIIQGITGAKLSGGRQSFDFPNVANNRDRLAAMFGADPSSLSSLVKADAKRSKNSKTNKSIIDKLRQDIQKGNLDGVMRMAKGGGVGTDTVPALLTPGEFVVNRSSAQSIGYGNLNRMNKVGKYAKGGIVQHFNSGTAMAGAQPARSASNPSTVAFVSVQALTQSAQAINQQTQAAQQNTQSQRSVANSAMDVVNNNKMFAATMATSLIAGFLPAVDEASSGMLKLTHHMLGVATTLTSVMFALEAFGVALNAKQIMQLFGSGPGGLGSLIKNAFSGFKMGAGGIAGPQPLGGGIASRIGGMFGAGRSALNQAGSKFGNDILSNVSNSKLARGFSAGLRGKSVIGGGSKSIAANIGGFAGQGVLGAKNIASSAYSAANLDLIQPSFSLGRQGKRLTQLGSGNRLSSFNPKNFAPKLANFAGRASTSQFAQGIGAGFTGNNLSFGKILGSSRGISAKAGGLLGRSAGLLGQGAKGLGGLAARAGGAVAGGLGGAGGAALAAAGPITAITGLVAIINGAVGAFKDLDGQLQRSIQAGKVEEASKLAVAKAAGDFPLIGNLLQGWSSDFDNLLVSAGTIFGGPSLDSVKALAAAQAGAVKTQKELDRAQKAATNAMQDFENGSISASEALSRIRTATAEVQKQEKRASDFAISNLENRASDGFTGRNAASFLTFGMVESSSARNQRLGGENADQIRQAAKFQNEAFQMESGARAATIRSGFARGRSRSEIEAEATGNLRNRRTELLQNAQTALRAGDEQSANAFNEAAEQLRGQIEQVEREMANLEKEVARAKAAFDAMNLGLRGPTATATAMSASMDRFVAGLEVGGSTFVANTEFLSTAMGSAAQAMDPAEIKQAVDDVAKNLSDMGANPAKFRANTEAFIQAQQNYNKAFEKIRSNIQARRERGQSPGDTPDEVKKAFASELTAGLGDEAKKNLTAIIQNIPLSQDEVDQIINGDLSVFGDKLSEAGKKQFEEIMKIAQERQKAEQVVISLIHKRADAERNLASAQKEAVDLYMEGRDIQAKYGGAAVTSGEKRAAIVARANAGAGNAGLQSMRTGSVAEIRARNAQIAGGIFGTEARRRTDGGMQGRAGAEADITQQNLQQAQKDQIDTIRSLIKLEEEELKIIQEKNKMEKDSLESLISGDIDKFFEQQAAVGAQAAIATGDMTLANQFGGKAVGDAFKDIQRQQEAGVQSLYGRQLAGPGGLTEQAAGAALASRGVMDPRMAQTLAGTSPEEAAAQRRLQELGGVLGETGAWQQATAEMQVQTASINVSNAEVKLAQIEERGRQAAEGFARGGVVYANRGMFVPRGTDTVPAMLTPGEFVVRREAVNRGNNLQLLEAINNNTSSEGFARGGKVGYYNNGGRVQYKAGGGLLGSIGGALGIDPQLITNLGNIFNTFVSGFNESIKNLKDTKLQVKLDSVNVNVNLNGTSMLTQISEETRNSIMEQVVQKIQNEYSVGGPGGKLIQNRSNLGR
jgi:TP901 family phage tail tape measure protein